MRQSRIPILDSEHVHSTSHLGQWPTASSSLHAGSGDDGSSSDEERDASPHVLIQPKPRAPNRPRSSLPSGVVYDARMRHHEEYMSSMEDNTPHPENSTRILAIWKTLAQKKLVQHDVYYPHPDPQDHLLARVDARYALKSEICLVHEKQYYRRAKSWQNLTESELVMIGKRDLESIYLHQTTFSVARLAAGGTIEICRQVVAGNLKNGIAVVRPPGHHAEPQVASGFCIFNNVAIAARVCQQHFPATCRKILILDWDVHHGNGIQKAFENDPNVLYISLHVYQNGLFYPGGTYGDENHCGEGPGLGYNVNIPWMTHGMGDGDYLLAFREIVIPIAEEFNPDLVIVAAGFDAAEGDTLGRCHVSPAGYAQMTHSLTKFANGKLVVVLEGGYTLPSIAKSALAVTQVLMDGEVDRAANPDPQPTASGRAVVELVKRKQAKYWKCMYPKPIEPAGSPGARSDRIHDVIREWQAYRFFKDYSMTPLMILRQGVSRTYNSQVLATFVHPDPSRAGKWLTRRYRPGYDQKKPLLVIFHDPPGAETIIDPRNGRLDWHNTFMVFPFSRG
ncbi:hypothetical protein EJ05DRAFT_442118 [Pseudovirgaria hyperparasitica]|uniref:histone deacetylase n=1 Tax=Pseudovirgaria hyperparasitica TaxID=470096 RepID=A0A6A6W161_9PEZI|nr:uncharacterized protein EJ05DRAFT_442118 [Pseudovirgaria hyperparasitica]KAF2755670.1 hypothetical protein EJ05DRAFT_442118 [Pseudovirgaria hyperparasitica]